MRRGGRLRYRLAPAGSSAAGGAARPAPECPTLPPRALTLDVRVPPSLPLLCALCSYALWLDADLAAGISRNSATFGNESLAGQEEFRVGAVELWGLS